MLRRLRALLPARLQREPGPVLAAGARRRRREARGGRQGRRHRLRARLVDDPDGAGVPELDVRRLRLPRGLDRDRARARAEEAGVADRVRFEAAAAAAHPGEGYDLVDDVRLPARHGRPGRRRAPGPPRRSPPDGTWLIVEPMAGDRVEDNLNPVGRAYYGFSTFLCTPASLSQEVGLALGAQAGEARIGDVVAAGGFTPLPPRGRDAVQPRVRGAARDDYDRPRGPERHRSRPARGSRTSRASSSATASASIWEALRRGRADDPAAAHVVDRPLAPSGRRRSPTSRGTSASSPSTGAATACRTGPRSASRLHRPRVRRRRGRRARRGRPSIGLRGRALAAAARWALMLADATPRARRRRVPDRPARCRC